MRSERERPLRTGAKTGESRKPYVPPELIAYGDVVRLTLDRAKNRGVGDSENRSSVAH